ncbi:MAG: cupin domain-containing protein [Gaiellaceae bacterium]
MRIFAFEPTSEITRFDSHGATIGGVARASGAVRVSLLQLAADGVVGAHPAACPQLFLVVAGSGWARSGAEPRSPLAAGEAALWEADEVHGSGSDGGLTAVIVEADEIEPLARPRL